MITRLRGLVLLAVAVFAAPASACEGEACANGLAYEAFGPKSAPVLAVFVHGDVSAGGPADYMYAHARAFAARHKGVAAVALLRPGYYDGAGKRSDGWDGGRFDTFDAGNNRTVAGALAELKQRYGARKLVALGHSGGAGAIGVIAGNHVGLLDGIVLAGCPCDVLAWRAMRGGRPRASQSPVDFLSGIPRGMPIVAITGSGDDNTLPALAQDYVAKAQAAGQNARLQIVGGHHGFGSIAGPSVRALGGMAR